MVPVGFLGDRASKHRDTLTLSQATSVSAEQEKTYGKTTIPMVPSLTPKALDHIPEEPEGDMWPAP